MRSSCCCYGVSIEAADLVYADRSTCNALKLSMVKRVW